MTPRATTPLTPSELDELRHRREWHLVDGALDALNAALCKTFPIYDDPEAGTDVDGDAVTLTDFLYQNGYVVRSVEEERRLLATLDAARSGSEGRELADGPWQQRSDAATPGPWVAQSPSDGQERDWYIDTHAYPDGPEPVWAPSYPVSAADVAFIVMAVNYVRSRLTPEPAERETPSR